MTALDAQGWEQIRAGRAPDPDVVAGVARSEAAGLGDVGAGTVPGRLSAAVPGAGPSGGGWGGRAAPA